MARKADVRRVAGRLYWREVDARILVDAWRKSGATLSGFATRQGVERKRLARWVRRLEGAAGGSLHFHPVRLVESTLETGGGAPIDIQLAGGHRVRVVHGFQTEDLRRVMAVLAETARC
jgi:hypothetical protein